MAEAVEVEEDCGQQPPAACVRACVHAHGRDVWGRAVRQRDAQQEECECTAAVAAQSRQP